MKFFFSSSFSSLGRNGDWGPCHCNLDLECPIQMALPASAVPGIREGLGNFWGSLSKTWVPWSMGPGQETHLPGSKGNTAQKDRSDFHFRKISLVCLEYCMKGEKPRSWKASKRMLFLFIFLYSRILLSSQSGLLQNETDDSRAALVDAGVQNQEACLFGLLSAPQWHQRPFYKILRLWGKQYVALC